MLAAEMHRGFLEDIIKNPMDDGLRLIYADWLEDNGAEARGEFIRAQVELAQCEEWLERNQDSKAWPFGTIRRRDDLRRRERDLLFASWPRWTHETFDHLAHDVGVAAGDDNILHVHLYDSRKNELAEFTCSFRRGFIAEVTLPCTAWVGRECGYQDGQGYPPHEDSCPDCHGSGRVDAHGPALVRSAPLERVTLSDKEPELVTFDSGSVYAEAEVRYWYRPDTGHGRESELPLELWRTLMHLTGKEDYGRYTGYGLPNRERMLDLLSRTCLTWANRTPVASPPLTR